MPGRRRARRDGVSQSRPPYFTSSAKRGVNFSIDRKTLIRRNIAVFCRRDQMITKRPRYGIRRITLFGERGLPWQWRLNGLPSAAARGLRCASRRYAGNRALLGSVLRNLQRFNPLAGAVMIPCQCGDQHSIMSMRIVGRMDYSGCRDVCPGRMRLKISALAQAMNLQPGSRSFGTCIVSAPA